VWLGSGLGIALGIVAAAYWLAGSPTSPQARGTVPGATPTPGAAPSAAPPPAPLVMAPRAPNGATAPASTPTAPVLPPALPLPAAPVALASSSTPAAPAPAPAPTETKATPAGRTLEPTDTVTAWEALEPGLRARLPPLVSGGTIHSNQREQRMVILDGQVLREGDAVNADVRVLSIEPQGVVLALGERLGGRRVRLKP
jgi:hypothetical protein